MGRNAVSCGWHAIALAASTALATALMCAPVVEAQQAANRAAAKKAKSGEESEQDAATKAPIKKKKQDPAEAQRAIEAAAKLLEHGKSEHAAQAITAVLAGGNLPPAIMAKALLYRGIAYRQLKKPAQAVADLTSALWLKGGLREGERADALRQRAAAYQEAGLSESGEIVTAAVPSPGPGTSPRASAARTAVRSSGQDESWGTSTTRLAPSANLAADEPQTQQAAGSAWSGFSNPFAGLFGGSSSPAAASSAPVSESAVINTAAIHEGRAQQLEPRVRSSSSAWSHNTKVSSSSTPALQTSALPVKPDGKFRIQLGMVRTQSEARALAAKVLREHAAALSQRQPEIDQAVVGNMGSFYRVRVGPFASQGEGQAACAKVKGPGVDCMVVAQ